MRSFPTKWPRSQVAGLLIVAATTLLVSCRGGVGVDSMLFLPVPAPATAMDYPIRIYRNALPKCSFEEIGLVTAEGGRLNVLAEALRRRAREMGGMAIIGLNDSARPGSGSTQISTTVPDSGSVLSVASFSVSSVSVLSGTVVRFRDPGCAE